MTKKNKNTKKIVKEVVQVAGLFIVIAGIIGGVYIAKMNPESSIVSLVTNDRKCGGAVIKASDGKIFEIKDAPSKRGKNRLVFCDKKTGTYFIKLSDDIKINIDTNFVALLEKQLEGSTEKEPGTVTLSRNNNYNIKNLDISVDVASNEQEDIYKKLIDYIDNQFVPFSTIYLRVYGGNKYNIFSTDKLVIRVDVPMYIVDMSTKHNKEIVFVKNIQYSINGKTINSKNSKEELKKKIQEFYNTNIKDLRYNQKKYLLYHLDYLIKHKQRDVKYIIITDGDFERYSPKYYDFDLTDFNKYMASVNNRLATISMAKARKVAALSNATTEAEKEQAKSIFIPSPLPEFNNAFFNYLINPKVRKLGDVYFELIGEGNNIKELSWFNNKEVFYNNLNK